MDVAHYGDAALERLGVHDYDVLIIDRDLPGTHGDKVCQAIVDRGWTTRTARPHGHRPCHVVHGPAPARAGPQSSRDRRPPRHHPRHQEVPAPVMRMLRDHHGCVAVIMILSCVRTS